jgi:2'-5' RNA ligase
LSTELLDFHRNHHIYFKEFNKNKESFYLPGKWSPHCTIASRLSDENMIQAFRYYKNNSNKIYGKLSEIALIEVELNDDGIAIKDTVVFAKALK